MGTKRNQSDSIPQSAPVRRGTMTGVLSAAAGAPCGVQVRRGREGSFLVLVVGTLALLAVITIVYVALGNADTRTKAAAQSRVQQDDVAPKVGEYIASVIADDVTATEFAGEVSNVVPTTGQPGGANLRALLRRETSDAPGVRPNLSTLPGTPANRVFDPVGQVNAQVQNDLFTSTAAAAVDPNNRIPASDPYLATLLPVNFNNEFARGQGPSSVVDPTRPYLYDLDWLSISNFAPDGAFISLENLRNNFGASSADLRRNKTLYDINGLPTQSTVFDTPADQDNPFHWTMYQQRAFQPGKLTAEWADADGDGMLDSRLFEMVDFFGGVGRRVVPSLNNTNVRWFVATRAVDLSGMVNLTTATEFTTGTNNSFVAGATPADVDLRRLLTQADIYADQNPAGQSAALAGYQGLIQVADPADLEGAGAQYRDLPQNYALYTEDAAFRAGAGAYAALRLSLATNTIIPRDIGGNPNTITLAEPDFQVTLDSSLLGAYGAELKNLDPGQPGELRALQSIFGAPFPATGALPTGGGITNSDWAAMRQAAWNQSRKTLVGGAYNATNTNDGALPGSLFTTADLGELLTRHGINTDERSALEGVIGGRDGTQAELTQRFDPLRSNRPESVELIRFEVDPATGIDSAPPVGSEQDRVMRMFGSDVRRLITPLNGARQFRSESSFIDVGSGAVASVDPERLQGNELKTDLRAILDSGDPADQGDLASLYRGYAAGLAPYSFLKGSWSRTQLGQRTATLSYGYRGPEAALITAAHMAVNLKDFADADTRPSAATVVLSNEALNALGTAANAPASNNALTPLNNFSPWFAGIDSLGYQEARNEFESRRLIPEIDPAAAAAKLADANTSVVAPALNVYGVEPQIFITQVSTMTMYMDDPGAIGPDPSQPVEIDPQFPNNAKSTFIRIVNSASIDEADSSEVMARIIGFKVTNPFDRPVSLSGAPFSDGTDPIRTAVAPSAEDLPTGRWVNGKYMDVTEFGELPANVRVDSLRDFHYIRVGQLFTTSNQASRYYLLMSMVEQVQPNGTYQLDVPSDRRVAPPITLEPIVVDPGETVLLYAISEPPARIAERIDDRGDWARVSGLDGQDVREFVQGVLTKQLGGGTGTDTMRRFWIPMYSPQLENTGTGIDPVSGLQDITRFVDVIPPDAPAPPPLGGGAITPQTVSLWRADRRLANELREIDASGAWGNTQLFAPDGGTPADQDTSALAPLGPRETFTPPPTVLAPNVPGNDILVDRFKLPLGTIFDSALPNPTADVTISGTRQVDDRDGVTLMLARTYRRPGDPGFDFEGGDTPRGVLPAYCIEPKYVTGTQLRPEDSWTFAQISDLFALPSLNTAAPTIEYRGTSDGNFLGDPNNRVGGPVPTKYAGAFIGFSEIVTRSLFNTSTALVPDAWKAPKDWSTSQMLANTENVTAEGYAYPGREFAATHGARPTQAGTLVADPLRRYYNEMYPSLLQAGGAALVTPATPTTLDILQSSMFRQERYNAAGQLIGQTLPDGQTVATISTLRLTDLLLPLGLGPMEMPVGAQTSPWPGTTALDSKVHAQFQQRYTTLSEAVAIAMGYEANVSATVYAQDPAMWLAPRGPAPTSEIILQVPTVPNSTDPLRSDASALLMFDAGQLALDRFVPFMDLDADRVIDANEQTWGLGVPAAVSVLDQFTTITAPSGLDRVPTTGGVQQIRDFVARRTREQLTTAVPGLININTAPVQVLRTLPLASPLPTLKTTVAQADLISGTVPPQTEWRTFSPGVNDWDNNPFLAWRVNVTGANSAPVIDQATDIAPTIAAVRDLYPERIRTDASIFMANRLAALGMPGAAQTQLITPEANIFDPIGVYTGGAPNGLANRLVPALWTWAGSSLNAADIEQLWTRTNETRERATRIRGIRSQPGFRSPAELLIARAHWSDGAANVNVGLPSTAAATANFRKEVVKGLPTNPDYLGFDQQFGPLPTTQKTRDISAAFRGLDPIQRHTLDTDLTPNGNVATSPNNTAGTNPRNLAREKLLIPGAMMSAATTRSDVYAVWFTIYGFREGDVNTPAPAPGQDPAPLLPSIQRRFLMVIDRSNVTQLGEKPRIVLFKEVPM